MDQLSSCYFCGGALDASLDEYPVVPESLEPEPDRQATVVLCPTCRRKLDGVVEAVLDAVDDGASVPDSGERTDADAGTEAGTEAESDEADAAGSNGETVADADIETTLGDDADVLRPVGDERENGAAESPSASAPDAEPGPDDGNGRKYTSSRRAGHRTTAGSDVGPGGSGDSHGTDDGDDDTGPDGDSDAAAGDDEDAGDETDDSDSGPDSVSLTRLENTSVMRLLQNREFPVERDDFVTVAASAYEVSPRDCEKVLDLAVEHDLLAERDGQLLAGPRWS